MEGNKASSSTSTKLILFAAVLASLLSLFFSLECSNSLLDSSDGGARLELLPLVDGAIGPESVAFDAAGEGPYTGVSDGRILKWHGKERGWLEYGTVSPPELQKTCKGSRDPSREHLCGRPLGLQFNGKTGELYVADAYHGLLVVGDGEKFATPVITEAQGFPFRFTNSLDIDERSGVIYFTDSSKRFQRREFMSAIVSGDRTGRLMSFDPKSKQLRVLLDGLSFPNGVVLGEDGSFLLIVETTTCRILRYWLRPPRTAASLEVAAELPGFPDNIRRSPRGGFWVALHSKRGRLVSWALSLPWLRRLLLAIGNRVDLQRLSSRLGRWRGGASAVRLDEEGEVLEVMEGFGGRKIRFISEVEERNGSLWIGSVLMPFVGVYRL